MSIKHDHTLNPVTALAFLSTASSLLILAGEGCYLKVFDSSSSRLLCQVKVFSDQTIHGIVSRSDETLAEGLQVVIWGGSSVILLKVSQVERILSGETKSLEEISLLASDWILDVAICPYDKVTCVLVTAHNTVLRARLESKGQTSLIETLSSPSRSILYSADLVWTSPTCILVAAGTVFGEIITWECITDYSGPSAGSKVLAVFEGHEGSIFGVDISCPVVNKSGEETRFLASCSDDRTIRIWDIYGSSASLSTQSNVVGDEASEDDGSSQNPELGNHQNIVKASLAMAMGHASRIWRVKFHIPPKSSMIDILSFGEDATTQRWTSDLGKCTSSELPVNSARSHGAKSQIVSDMTVALSHVQTYTFHSGKQIWSAAIHHLSSDTSVIITGGADGKISAFDFITADSTSIDKTLPEENSDHYGQYIQLSTTLLPKTWTLEDITTTLPQCASTVTCTAEKLDQSSSSLVAPSEATTAPAVENGKKPKKVKPKKIPQEALNQYTFISSRRLLLTTTFGRVFLGEIGASVSWRALSLPELAQEGLKGYSVLEGNNNRAVIADSSGNVFLYTEATGIQRIAKVDGKVADIFLSKQLTTSIDVIVTVLGSDTVALLQVQLSDPDSDNIETHVRKVSFRVPERFVVTSTCISEIEQEQILLLGSRHGSIALYDFHDVINGVEEPRSVWTPALRGDSITSISLVSVSPIERLAYYLTTSRDGVYSIFASSLILNGDKIISIVFYPVHRGTPPLGPNIEEAWFDGGDLLLAGFRSKNFVVWNETKQCEITNVECGGAHKSFAYIHIENGRGCFVYTKDLKLYIHAHHRPSHRIVKSGGHGREIKACAVAHSANRTIIATGAEDTALRIWNHTDTGSEVYFHCLAVVQKHTAGIQHLHWHKSQSSSTHNQWYLFSSGGNEEFFFWRVTHIEGFGFGIICEATCPDQTEERDLRIMNFDVTELNGPDNEAELIISLAYSDSTIRAYRYSRTSGFELVFKERYTSSCLMHIRHLQITENDVIFLTAATDGYLVLWNGHIPNLSSQKADDKVQKVAMLSRHKPHQSTIKCLDFVVINDLIVLATGGDDNALAITSYSVKNIRQKPKSFVLRSAHATAITALCILPIRDSTDVDEIRVISSGNDQRVKEWSFSIADGRLQKLGDTFTSVADVGDISVIRQGMGPGEAAQVLVVGNGMETFYVSSEV